MGCNQLGHSEQESGRDWQWHQAEAALAGTCSILRDSFAADTQLSIGFEFRKSQVMLPHTGMQLKCSDLSSESLNPGLK